MSAGRSIPAPGAASAKAPGWAGLCGLDAHGAGVVREGGRQGAEEPQGRWELCAWI